MKLTESQNRKAFFLRGYVFLARVLWYSKKVPPIQGKGICCGRIMSINRSQSSLSSKPHEEQGLKSPSPLVKITRQRAIEVIIYNLKTRGVILANEIAMYRSVIQDYDDQTLLDTLEWTEQLKQPSPKN
jgi:hypothetical protein